MRLHGRGACSHVMLAAAASWAGRSITYAFQATSISNVEIDHLNFSCPVGRAHFGGGPAHILQMISVTKLSVHDNIADGCGDFLANIGGTDVTAYNNRVTNSDNACFDNWGGFTDSKVIRNTCSLMAASGSGVAGIWFTGTNTDGTAATSRRGTAIGNTIYVNTDNQVGIGLNATSGGVNTGHIVADNRIIVNAVSVFAILATGASECRITHNKIVGIGGVSGAAIRVARPATNCDVKDNLAVNWAKAGSGVFQYTGTTGTVSGNKCSGTCATLLGAFPSGVLHSANDNGAGTGRR
ncbi:MAG: hypothetical protein JOY77_08325 [Alphaproteobacteria bacterium]|nr:hypothetical protein [Alphaproteobacteria bacterium]